MTTEEIKQDPSNLAEVHKQTKVIVNGRERDVESEELTFDQAVQLAFDQPSAGKDTMFTVTFRNGGGRQTDGSIVAGGSVKVQDGTVFHVTATDKS